MQVVRHAHWCAGFAAGENVEHAGGNLYPGLWVQLFLRLGVHGKEEPAIRAQLVPDCRREQTYIRRGIVCYVNCKICYLVHLELKIGLVNDIVCGLIYVNIMPVMDMIICEP